MDFANCLWLAAVIAVVCALLTPTLRADEPPPPNEPPPRSAEAEQPKPDKSGYTLFNPVPHSQLRELQTDRPDLTEGPFTVDAGHVQLESDLVNYGYDRRQPGAARITSQFLDVADVNVRIGLLNNFEFDAIAYPFSWGRDEDRRTGAAAEREGFGDTTLRLKWNFFGNDVDRVPSLAVGLLPYLKIPSNSGHLANHYLEGGVIVPADLTLPDTWEIGVQTEVDGLHEFNGRRGYYPQWVNSIVLHRDVIHDRLNAYIEYYNATSGGHHIGPLETADTGFLLAITKDIQLDIGINFGLTKRAPDYNPFLGLSVRF